MPGSESHLAAMASAAGAVARPHGRFSPGWQAAWGSWLSISAVLIVIWVLAGMGYPWFAWIVGPWGALLLARWISGGHPDGGGPRGTATASRTSAVSTRRNCPGTTSRTSRTAPPQ